MNLRSNFCFGHEFLEGVVEYPHQLIEVVVVNLQVNMDVVKFGERVPGITSHDRVNEGGLFADEDLHRYTYEVPVKQGRGQQL